MSKPPRLMMANRYLTPAERLRLNPPLPFHWHYPRMVPMHWARVRTIQANAPIDGHTPTRRLIRG